MRCPTESGRTLLKRLARYLKGTSDAFVRMALPKLDGRVELVKTPTATGLVMPEAGRATPLVTSLQMEFL